MKAYIVEFVKQAKHPKSAKFRKQLYILLLCLAISVFIWLLIKLSQDSQTTVRYKINITKPPAEKILEQDTKYITLSLRSKGSNLFSLKYLTLKPTIEINLNEYYYRQENKSKKYYLTVKSLRKDILSKLNTGEEILKINPDTVFFYLSEMTSKKVKVIPDLELNFEKQYFLYDSISVVPSEIIIKGPGIKIDTIKNIKTQHKVLENINESMDFSVRIVKPLKSSDISYSNDNVKIKIDVEKYTEANTDIEISNKTLENNNQIRTFPEEITITYMVALKDFKRVNNEMFELNADFDEAIRKGKSRVKVSLVKHPPFVKILNIEPSTVEYIILK